MTMNLISGTATEKSSGYGNTPSHGTSKGGKHTETKQTRAGIASKKHIENTRKLCIYFRTHNMFRRSEV